MTKNRQKFLTYWLKSKNFLIKHLILLSIILGLINGFLIICHAWILSCILQSLIITHQSQSDLIILFVILTTIFILRAGVLLIREQINFISGNICRRKIRSQILNCLSRLGPAWIRLHLSGSLSSMLVEQIENLHDFYARYIPQIYLSVLIPFIILIFLFPINWMSSIILLITAPLIPIFMTLVGMGAADANRRNFFALSKLSGYFFDRLRGLDTLRLFSHGAEEINNIQNTTEDFRKRTMEVLRLAFLSSGVLEFFSSISIAMIAVYFGFSYLGILNFGSYGIKINLCSGFIVLILAPEFFQPLRDLGLFYHAKAQAIGAADSLQNFLDNVDKHHGTGNITPLEGPVTIIAKNLIIFSSDGIKIAGPLDFTLIENHRVAIVGASGSGKSSLLNLLLGFLPYCGSLKINGLEFCSLSKRLWRERISWISQNPILPAITLRENILLGSMHANDDQLEHAVSSAYVSEFLNQLPNGLDSLIGENSCNLSVGQAQRVAVARALLRNPDLLLLDEPTASLDSYSEKLVLKTLNNITLKQTTLMVTHKLCDIINFDKIWVMDNGKIIQQGNYSELAFTPGPLAELITFHN